jgi:predicted transcriptional regulator
MFEKNDVEMSHVSKIVAAYVSRHEMIKEQLPNFIQLVYRSLRNINSEAFSNLFYRAAPMVPIEDSIHPDYIICLEDGKKFKMLKRHLKVTYDMTPDQYRQRWDLPHDYPMSSPNYSLRRKDIAKSTGLGSHSRNKKKRAA